ncbi:Uncharacterized protein Rs2_02667 [Raphanus sativus]|nr:Uncharacterized protein Rs2_02667 [Raphanus sativus]
MGDTEERGQTLKTMNKDKERVWRIWWFRWDDGSESFKLYRTKLRWWWIRRRSASRRRRGLHRQHHGGGGDMLQQKEGLALASDLDRRRSMPREAGLGAFESLNVLLI